MKKKIRKFATGGEYSGDDPIVKYRMGQLSEADTYDALGQKDLANVSRAKESKTAPVVDKQDYGYQYRNNDNFYNTSSPEDIANASFAKAQTETTPIKTTIKPNSVTKTQTKVTTEVPKVYSDQNDRRSSQLPSTDKLSTDKLSTDKTAPLFSKEAGKQMKEDEDRTIASIKNYAKNATLGSVAKDAIGLLPISQGVKRLGYGVKGAQLLLENSEKGRKLLGYAKDVMDRAKQSGGMKDEFRSQDLRPDFKKGGKVKTYKSGGSVKSEPARSSASKRADGIATKGFTRACGGGMMKGKK